MKMGEMEMEMEIQNLKGNSGKRRTHASKKGKWAFFSCNIFEDAKRRTHLLTVLLSDSNGVKRVSGDNSGDSPKSTGQKLFAPTACKKLRPKIHLMNLL